MSSHAFPLRKGISPIQLLLLVQMKHGPKYGYEMLTNIREEFEGVWEPQTGTIYPALKNLEGKGLIQTEKREETEYYSLTEEGEDSLLELGARVSERVKFTFRYMRFLTKWIHPDMLPTIIGILETVVKEDQLVFPHLIKKLDSETKNKVYRDFQEVSKRREEAFEETLEA
jgi:DNA-binding PadR family transcriptional regulator